MSGSEKIVVPGTNVLRRAGNTLISSEASEAEKIEAFKVLTAWRSLHTYPIDTFQKTLRRRCGELKFRWCIKKYAKKKQVEF